MSTVKVTARAKKDTDMLIARAFGLPVTPDGRLNPDYRKWMKKRGMTLPSGMKG